MPYQWCELLEVLFEDQKMQVHHVANVCATIMNMSGKEVKNPVKPEDLIRNA